MHLSIPDCEGATGAEIQKLVALELVPRFAIAPQPPAALEASLQCGTDRASIRVRDNDRDAALELEVPLADTRREARPRLLALAIAELIATSRLEPAQPAPRPPPPEPPRAKNEPEAPAAEPAFSIEASAGVVRAFEPALWAPGLRLAAAYGGGLLLLHADLDFSWTSRDTTEATLTASTLSFALAPGLRLWNSALDWHLGAGLRGGPAWLEATARSSELRGKSVSGIFLAPLAWTAFSLPLSAAWHLTLALELAYIIKPVRGFDAQGTTLLELSGVRLASWLGAGAKF